MQDKNLRTNQQAVCVCNENEWMQMYCYRTVGTSRLIRSKVKLDGLNYHLPTLIVIK